MPIDRGTKIVEKRIIRGTARFQSDPRTANGEMIANPMTEFYRATIEESEGTSRMEMDAVPIQVRASDLEGLAEFAEIPAQLQGMIAPEQLAGLFKLVPALISMIGDAAERKSIADAETVLEAPEAPEAANATETSPQ